MTEVLYTDGGEIRFRNRRVYALQQSALGESRLIEIRDARDIARRFPNSGYDEVLVITVKRTPGAEQPQDWLMRHLLARAEQSAQGALLADCHWTGARRATGQDHVTRLSERRKTAALEQLAKLLVQPSPTPEETTALWLSTCSAVGPNRFDDSVDAFVGHLERRFRSTRDITQHDVATQLADVVPTAKLLAEARRYPRPMSPAVAALRPDYGEQPAVTPVVRLSASAIRAATNAFLPTPSTYQGVNATAELVTTLLTPDHIDEMLADLQGTLRSWRFVSWGDGGDPDCFTMYGSVDHWSERQPAVVRCRAVSDAAQGWVDVEVVDVFEPRVEDGWDPAGSGSRRELEAFIRDQRSQPPSQTVVRTTAPDVDVATSVRPSVTLSVSVAAVDDDAPLTVERLIREVLAADPGAAASAAVAELTASNIDALAHVVAGLGPELGEPLDVWGYSELHSLLNWTRSRTALDCDEQLTWAGRHSDALSQTPTEDLDFFRSDDEHDPRYSPVDPRYAVVVAAAAFADAKDNEERAELAAALEAPLYNHNAIPFLRAQYAGVAAMLTTMKLSDVLRDHYPAVQALIDSGMTLGEAVETARDIDDLHTSR